MRLHLQTWRWAPSKVSLDFNRLSRPHEIFILNLGTSPCYPESWFHYNIELWIDTKFNYYWTCDCRHYIAIIRYQRHSLDWKMILSWNVFIFFIPSWASIRSLQDLKLYFYFRLFGVVWCVVELMLVHVNHWDHK